MNERNDVSGIVGCLAIMWGILAIVATIFLIALALQFPVLGLWRAVAVLGALICSLTGLVMLSIADRAFSGWR